MKVNLIVIRTDKPKELAAFYEQLEMKFDYHQHGGGPWHFSTKIKGTVFEIYPLMKNQEVPDKSLRLGFEIENLEETISNLKKNNVEIVRAPTASEWRYFAIIKDLDGRKIELKKKPTSDIKTPHDSA